MNYLRNCWYVAGHAEEASQKPFGRTLLDEPVVIYRTEAGALVAMDDRCPHRLAPLHGGKVCGEHLECPYHGLRFDPTGACVLVPNGDPAPVRAKVKTYPLLERYGMLWIWMGDPALADPSVIPDFSRLERKEDGDWWTAYLHAKGNYQLYMDNLMDLSHTEFLHPMLSSPGYSARLNQTVEQKGNTVYLENKLLNDTAPAFVLKLDPRISPIGTTLQTERWDPPSLLLLVNDFTSETGSFVSPGAHFLTPETQSTTHYFLRAAQTVQPGNAELTAMMKAATLHVFQTEDLVIIEGQHRNLGGADLMDRNPVLLRQDSAAARVRRVLTKLLNAEAEAQAVSESAGAAA